MNISTNSRTITFLVVCIILLAMSAGCLTMDYPASLSERTHYTLDIKTDKPLYNVTFYLPLPVRYGKPMVGSLPLAPEAFEKAGYSVSFTRFPPDRNQTRAFPGEYPVPGNEPWYVRISSDYWPNGSYRIEIVNRSALSTPALFLDTRYPIGNHSVFLPKLNFSAPQVTRKSQIVRLSSLIEYDSQTVPQTIPLYVDYITDPVAVVDIYSSIEGENQWLDGPDAWHINNYWDSFGILQTGQRHGWYPASEKTIDGKFSVGNGKYPDLSEPEWQKMMNRT